MKPIYQINKKNLRYPRECFSNWLHYMLGIRSPSRVLMTIFGAYGEDVREKYITAWYENVRLRVNKRTATKQQWRSLRLWERRKEREGWHL